MHASTMRNTIIYSLGVCVPVLAPVVLKGFGPYRVLGFVKVSVGLGSPSCPLASSMVLRACGPLSGMGRLRAGPLVYVSMACWPLVWLHCCAGTQDPSGEPSAPPPPSCRPLPGPLPLPLSLPLRALVLHPPRPLPSPAPAHCRGPPCEKWLKKKITSVFPSIYQRN